MLQGKWVPPFEYVTARQNTRISEVFILKMDILEVMKTNNKKS